jgi:hypothetical protein
MRISQYFECLQGIAANVLAVRVLHAHQGSSLAANCWQRVVLLTLYAHCGVAHVLLDHVPYGGGT